MFLLYFFTIEISQVEELYSPAIIMSVGTNMFLDGKLDITPFYPLSVLN